MKNYIIYIYEKKSDNKIVILKFIAKNENVNIESNGVWATGKWYDSDEEINLVKIFFPMINIKQIKEEQNEINQRDAVKRRKTNA